nr:immunoglobulin heavy chain junction region [Macaca mulatta]
CARENYYSGSYYYPYYYALDSW